MQIPNSSRRPSRLGPSPREQQLDRALGALAGALKVGPAVRAPVLHDVLHRLGVLQRHPDAWEQSALYERLPWGAQRLAAPAPAPPPGIDGPWPQRPELAPALYPPVLNLEGSETRDHFESNVARYLGQIVRLTPPSAWRALRGPRLVPIDDERLASLLTDTSLGQFVSTELDDDDRARFHRFLTSGDALYAKADFSFAPAEDALPGVYVAGTVTLFRREGARYRVIAIRVGDRVFGPEDGVSWQLARYFVLQGAATRLVLTDHPRLHFATDVINAVTRSILPAGHRLHALIEPHTVFTAGLNDAVIHHRRSVLLNSQREIYAPLAYTIEGIIKLIAAGRNGVSGSRAYTPYRFGEDFCGDHVPYGRYRRDWFDAYLRLVGAIVREIPPNDPHVQAWAEHIAAWLPGFPGPREIARGDALARAVTSYICSVSVFHSGDHHAYSAIPISEIPWRLRVPPPDQETPAELDLTRLVSSEDYFRHQLCHAMFFVPVIRRPISAVRYRFRDARALAAAKQHHRDMAELDARWSGAGFPRSTEIACSIHY
jgi:hypothetical protein